MKRRRFIYRSSQAGLAFSILGMAACKENKPKQEEETAAAEAEPFFSLSLAQWSIHRMIREDGLDPYQFAAKSKEWGFSGLEYVSQLYRGTLEPAGYSKEAMDQFVSKCNEEAEKHGLVNLIIMVDGEGDLATSDEAARQQAVENHHKWVDAAAAMGCHSIRVNLSGENEVEAWVANSKAGLGSLAQYAADKNVNVIVENHGGLSSNGELLARVMAEIDMENCGTLPDFGNFCITSEYGSTGERTCTKAYDKYKGVKELMPYAKAVSAKSYRFDEDGNEIDIDYARMLQIVKDAGYTGYIGVEYEGSELSETDGILATKNLLINASKEVS